MIIKPNFLEENNDWQPFIGKVLAVISSLAAGFVPVIIRSFKAKLGVFEITLYFALVNIFLNPFMTFFEGKLILFKFFD